MSKETESKWIVLLDGEIDARFSTREKARSHARWLRGHPATSDRRRFGHGGVVEVEHED